MSLRYSSCPRCGRLMGCHACSESAATGRLRATLRSPEFQALVARLDRGELPQLADSIGWVER